MAAIYVKVIEMLPGLPAEVPSAWRDTANRRIYQSEPGAWPTPIF